MNNQIENQTLSFVQALEMILNPSDLHLRDSETAKAEMNTLAIRNSVLGVVYPRSLEQLQAIVRQANKFGVAIYPVSQGKNIGYGEMTPMGNNQLVIGLKHFNQIRKFDSRHGEVWVEPGVTQNQLAQFLKSEKAAFWGDMTGASPDASLIGNTLEAGFGHSPIGDHRKHILQMEVMLADGTIVTTSEMPAMGPDLAQLFVQSNFGIVTAMKIPLLPIPETTVTFIINFQTNEDFYKGVEVLSDLRRDGTISSLAHTGNTTRALMTSSRFPQECDPSQVLTEEDCLKILNEKSLIRLGAWSCVGTIYGYRKEVQLKLKRIQKATKGVGRVKTFTGKKIEWIERILNSPLSRIVPSLAFTKKSFESIKALHGISRGQPSNHPSENIYWRVTENERLGLMWHAPVIPATAKDCEALLMAARYVYEKYRFEMPVTLTIVDAKHMTSVFNIGFDKFNAEETRRAHEAYKEFVSLTNSLGYFPYRVGLASRPEQCYSPEQRHLLAMMKKALDPQGILAPGRYGIGAVEGGTKAKSQNKTT